MKTIEEMKMPSLELSDKQRTEGEKRIYNLIILDESGSMDSIYEQALSGANETINTIRNAQKEDQNIRQYLTFVTFDSSYKRPDVRAIISNKPIDEVKDLTKEDYRPNGCTPLYDAMGMSINALKELVKEGDHALVTIITDGYENSSKFYSSSMVKEIVESLRAKGWVFTYIGANQDSVEVAGGLGIHNSMDFCQDAIGSQMMFEKLSSSHMAYFRKASRMSETGIREDLESDFFTQKRGPERITPEALNPEELKDGERVVLESNERGTLGKKIFIQTTGTDFSDIRRQISKFILMADAHPEIKFYVTRVGCGAAGYSDVEIAPLFARAYSLMNVALPESFWKVLDYKFRK